MEIEYQAKIKTEFVFTDQKTIFDWAKINEQFNGKVIEVKVEEV